MNTTYMVIGTKTRNLSSHNMDDFVWEKMPNLLQTASYNKEALTSLTLLPANKDNLT